MAGLDDIQWELGGDVTGGSQLVVDDAPGPLRSEEIHETPLPVWTLVARNMTAAELAILESRFDAARGRAGTTTYTPPGGSSTVVEFLDDELDVTWLGHDHYSASVRVRKVL